MKAFYAFTVEEMWPHSLHPADCLVYETKKAAAKSRRDMTINAYECGPITRVPLPKTAKKKGTK